MVTQTYFWRSGASHSLLGFADNTGDGYVGNGASIVVNCCLLESYVCELPC